MNPTSVSIPKLSCNTRKRQRTALYTQKLEDKSMIRPTSKNCLTNATFNTVSNSELKAKR